MNCMRSFEVSIFWSSRGNPTCVSRTACVHPQYESAKSALVPLLTAYKIAHQDKNVPFHPFTTMF